MVNKLLRMLSEVEIYTRSIEARQKLFTKTYTISPVSGLNFLRKKIKASKKAKYLKFLIDSNLNRSRELEIA